MVIGETNMQGEKKDEASNLPKKGNETAKTVKYGEKGTKKKEAQTKESNEDDMQIRSGGEGTSSDMFGGRRPVSSTPTTKTTVAELKRQLQLLHLPTNGNKAQLEYRLKMYENPQSSDDNREDDEGNDEGNTSDSEKDEETMIKASDETSSESDNSDEETVARGDEPRVRRRRTGSRHQCGANIFTIKDVEGSISQFSGDDKMQVEQWIEEFEGVSELLKWNELQKVIYAKKLLRGSAKQYMALQKGITTWATMKRRMRREFETKLNSALIHSQLVKRKRLLNETPRQYVYAMNTIANQGTVEEEALMQYIIDGISDDENNKAILYNANTITELRKNLERYDRIKEKTGRKPRKEQSKNKMKEIEKGEKNAAHGSKKDRNEKESRCYGCGSTEHIAPGCPDKEKGPKCFNCNNFGHIAAKCEEPDKTLTRKNKKINAVNIITQAATDDEIMVEINDTQIQSMMDTGTYQTMLKYKEYERIGKPKLRPVTSTFQGFGNAVVKANGVFRTAVAIQGEKYEVEIHVVPDGAMQQSMLLGKELTRQMEVNIRGGQISIKKLTSNEDSGNSSKENDDDTKKYNNEELHELPCINCIEESPLDVNEQYRKKIEKLIEEHDPAREVQTTVETKIILQDDEPICMRPRRLAVKEKTILNRQIDEWLRDGIIQPSKSKYSSPVVIVPKKNGEYRVCVDYRQLNKKIIRDRFPMPLIDDRIDALANARVFSVLDLKNGFFHVPVSLESRKYTAFVTPEGQYEFLKTPFGLCISPTSFLRFIEEVFHDLSRKNIVFTYVDDLIVPGRDYEEAFTNLQETLKVTAQKGLSINWRKCEFLKNRVEYLGHIIENGTVAPSPTKIKAVKDYPKPTSKKALQSFLGLTGYFRKFIYSYAQIAKPLSEVLKNDQRFRFGTKEEQAFNQLKQLLTTEPILQIYKPDAITELHTDASKEGYGATLLQKGLNNDRFHVVYYMSRKTSEAEKKLHSYELEALAVVQAVKKFRVYLLGIKFKLVTDCSALQKTLSKQDISPKVARWALMLEEFEYEAEHRVGTRLKHVDALSRYPVMVIEDKIIPVIRKQQDEEERLKVIKKMLETEPYEDYLCENGILMKRMGNKNVIVLPTSMQQDVIRTTHENGHFGVKKMLESITSEYYIPKLTKKLEDYVSCCIPCILAEKKRGKKEGTLVPIPKGDVPLHTYHVDHLGPITATAKLYKHLLVVVDGFSKFVWIYPTKTTATKEVLDRLKTQQKTFGNPSRIISDRGTAFTSMDFRDYCTEEKIEHILITTGVPRGNGQVERINRIILPILTKLAQDCPDKWYRLVDQVQSAINSTYQRSIGTSPFEILFGVKMRQKEDIKLLSLVEQEMISSFEDERKELRVLAKENIKKIQRENKKTHDKKCKSARKYQVGDLVAIKRTQFVPGSKIKTNYLGPYRVSEVKGYDRYEMIREGNSEGPKMTTSSADQMKPYSPGTGD